MCSSSHAPANRSRFERARPRSWNGPELREPRRQGDDRAPVCRRKDASNAHRGTVPIESSPIQGTSQSWEGTGDPADTRKYPLMAPVACPNCSIVAYETVSGGWRFDPPTGCVELRDTEWGAKGELEWCPALAAAMPDEVFWPGQSHRDHVRKTAKQAQARITAPKKDSET